MGSIVSDVQFAAEWISKALKSSGYNADFEPASLWEIDRFFDEQSENGKAVLGGLLGDDLGKRLFGLGSYIGEVLRRSMGGDWRGDDSDPEAEFNIELRLTNGSICWPIQRAMKRFSNGPEDGIVAYGVGMGLSVGERPVRKKKPWYKFW